MRHYYVDCHGKSKLEALELLLRVLNRGTMATVVFSNVSRALFLAGLAGLRLWYADPAFRFTVNAHFQDQSECMWLCDEMIAQGREAYCVCPTLMDDVECQQQRDAFVNRIGSSTVDMFCTNLWSMLFWKALVRINFSTPANVDDYMEQAQYRKAGHVVSGKFVDFKNHVRVELFQVYCRCEFARALIACRVLHAFSCIAENRHNACSRT